MRSSILLPSLALLCAAAGAIAATQTIPLTGSNADGYLAIVGFNQEVGTIAEVNSNPSNPKFFDYPKYVNPLNPERLYIMSVEPYRFGLTYPTLLHPTGPGAFSNVSSTFTEGFSEDADFHQFNIGAITYDDALLTGVGTEVIGIGNFNITLSGTDFEATNRTQLDAADVGPFGPAGRSNRNEFSNAVTLSLTNLSGLGLTFVNGVLTSMDFSSNVHVSALPDALAQFVGFFGLDTADIDADGTLTFSGLDFAFAVDGQDSSPVASDVRLILNRTGTISVPEPGSAWFVAMGLVVVASRRRLR